MLVSAGALVYSRSTNRYLFLLRQGSSYANNWGLAGGKMQPGESLESGLRRELGEELGPVEFERIVPIEKFTSDNQQFVFHTFLAVVEAEFTPILNQEHKGYCWVELADYPRPLHPGVWKTFGIEAVMSKVRTAVELLR
jgi:8-oxo-dGTP pyrophosphatase MutT (NUDIX family)